MLLGNADELFDIVKGFVPYYLLIALPLMIIISPVNPVAAAQEFQTFRMQQYDLHGVPHGMFAYLSRNGRMRTKLGVVVYCNLLELWRL